MEIPRNQHARILGENQLIKSDLGPFAYMSRYPDTPKAREDFIGTAKEAGCILNFMERGDFPGLGKNSYADDLKLNQPEMWGRYEVTKLSQDAEETVGPNGQGGDLKHGHAVLQVRDTTKPDSPPTLVDYHHFDKWKDTTPLPQKTMANAGEIIENALYKKGQPPIKPLTHCAGGVGRTPTALVPLYMNRYIREQNSKGYTVLPIEAEHQLAKFITNMREMRGTQVLPDKGQVASVYELMLTMLKNQNPRRSSNPLPFGHPYHTQQLIKA